MLRATNKLVLIASLASLAACGAPVSNEVDRDAIAKEVEAKAGAIVEAVNNHDPEATSQFNAPDYEFYSHGFPNVVGAEAALANNQSLLSDTGVSLQARNVRVEVAEAGDLAIYSADYSWSFTDPATGQFVPETGNWILIFKRQDDGSLKVFREIASDTPMAATE